jgi:hypothetical protein
MTSRRREDCDTCYRRACRLLGTNWADYQPSGLDVRSMLEHFVSAVFSVPTGTLAADIGSEMKKMGKPVAAAAVVSSHAPKPVPIVCAQCGNPLVDGKCRFINHRVS